MADLKGLGLILIEPLLVEKYYSEMRGIFVKQLDGGTNGLFLDIRQLPTEPINIREAFVRWLISVNLSRIRRNEVPITDLSVILKCPLWKSMRPPLKRVEMSPEGLFNQPSGQNINAPKRRNGINKR